MKNKINFEKVEKWCKIGLVIFVFLLTTSIAVGTKYGTGPDEFMKYDVVKYISDNMALPDGRDESIRNNVWGLSYAFTPYLTYMISGVLVRGFSYFTSNPDALFFAARIPCIIFITIFAIFVIKIGDKIFDNKKYKWLFILMLTLWPQVIYIGGYVNNDALALMSTAMIVYAWLRAREKKWDTKSCVLLAVAVALCALSYYNAYGFILCSMVFFLINTIQKKLDKKEIVKKGLIIAGIAAVLGGWFFIRNAVIYDGDFLGLKTENETAEMYAMDEYKPSLRTTLKSQGESFAALFVKENWVPMTAVSFVGLFGPMNVEMSAIAYILYMAIILVGIFGIFYTITVRRADKIRKRENIAGIENFEKMPKKERKALILTMLAAIIIPVALSLYYSYASDYQPQGRYVLPMIVPFLIFLAMGVENIIESVIKKEKTKKIIVEGLYVLLAVLPLYYVFLVIIPTI